MGDAKRDQNYIPTLLGVSNADGETPVVLWADPVTHRLLVDMATLSSHIKRDQFTSTNNQTVFTASETVVADMLMIVNGVIQSPSFDYTLVGSTYTLSSGIPAGLQVIILYIY